MKLIASLEGKEHAIQIDPSGEITLDGQVYQVDARRLGPDVTSVLINGRSYDIDVEPLNPADPLDGRLAVRVRGRVIPVEILGERALKMKKARGLNPVASGPLKITSPMPGKLMRLLVAAGDKVLEGQGVAVVEAMKMENELKAQRSGLVKEVFAATGDTLERGTLILTIA
ncbi:MAG: biotin/lipoyl-containing protein [Myxococcota bacterium]